MLAHEEESRKQDEVSNTLKRDDASIEVLLNRQVSLAAFENVVKQAVSALQSDDLLLIVFSGHTGKDDARRSSFYFPDWQRLQFAPFLLSVLARHPKTVFIVEGGFDTTEIA